MNIQPGTYIGKIVSHAISETKAGDPQAAINFSFEGHTLTWYGTFKEGKGRDITIKTLIACGLKGNSPAGPLEVGKELSLVVDDEVGQDGKTRTKIKWVNPIGGIKNVLSDAAARAKLGALEGAVMAARSNQAVEEEIPF